MLDVASKSSHNATAILFVWNFLVLGMHSEHTIAQNPKAMLVYLQDCQQQTKQITTDVNLPNQV